MPELKDVTSITEVHEPEPTLTAAAGATTDHDHDGTTAAENSSQTADKTSPEEPQSQSTAAAVVSVTTVAQDERYAKYFKMVKMGVPLQVKFIALTRLNSKCQ